MNDQLRAAVKDLQGRNMVKELKLVRVDRERSAIPLSSLTRVPPL